LDFDPLYVIGALVVCVRAAPVGVFACVHLAYVAMLRHMDLFRYALPAAVFVVLIGLDALWAHPWAKRAVACVAPVYIVEMMAYSAGQIHSNRCSDEFLGTVLDAAVDHLH
jgi:hypothetical protein